MPRSASYDFACISDTGLDANDTSTVSTVLDVLENRYISFDVQDNSGTHSNHVITLQISFDNSTWYNTSSTKTGTGFVENVQVTARYVRLKVTTAEGSASIVDINIHAK
jgi:hypothetical protein